MKALVLFSVIQYSVVPLVVNHQFLLRVSFKNLRKDKYVSRRRKKSHAHYTNQFVFFLDRFYRLQVYDVNMKRPAYLNSLGTGIMRKLLAEEP